VTIEKTYRLWKLVLGLLLVTFFLMQGWLDFTSVASAVRSRLGTSHFDGIWPLPGDVGLVAALTTMGLFAAAVVRWAIYRLWISRHPELRGATRDELVQRNWLRAFRISWLLSIGVVLLGSLVTFVIQLIVSRRASGQFSTLELILPGAISGRFYLVAVTSLLASFLIFDRERSRE
jgi:hypothetical protein